MKDGFKLLKIKQKQNSFKPLKQTMFTFTTQKVLNVLDSLKKGIQKKQ